jgi:hypothetical protein
MIKRFLLTFLTAAFIIGGTVAAIFWGRGYRPNFQDGKMQATGLLAANSSPTGAQVFVNDKLTTATNNTVNLSPGEYKVKIVKDGYLPWEKTLEIQKELVVQTNALLFPAAPDLKALTYTGALNPIPSPDGQKIAFLVASSSAEVKNGLYVMDLSPKPLSFRSDIRQIAKSSNFDFGQASWIWSPDSLQILVFQKDEQGTIQNSVLLDATNLNEGPFADQTEKLATILPDWEEQVGTKNKERYTKLPKKLQDILTSCADHLYWSPDEVKLLYTATASATIADGLISPLPASNTQPEKRKLEPGKIYVYDTKEDRNFEVGTASKEFVETKSTNETASPTDYTRRLSALLDQYMPIFSQSIQWFPDSQHLIEAQDNKIIIKEYDSTNAMKVYTGPLVKTDDIAPFVYPWPDASKLIIITNLNRDLPSNLYAVNLK